MHNSIDTTTPVRQRKSRLLLLFLCLSLPLSACAGIQPQPTRIVTVQPYSACLQRCAGMEERSAFERDGCRRGCELALSQFSLRGAHFATREACLESVTQLDHADGLARLAERCEDTWEGAERRAGCAKAGEAFYQAVNENMCRSDMP